MFYSYFELKPCYDLVTEMMQGKFELNESELNMFKEGFLRVKYGVGEMKTTNENDEEDVKIGLL